MAIDRDILTEYNDLCAQVIETEAQLRKMIAAENEVVHDSVKGSNPEFPYEPITFHIEGIGRRVHSKDVEILRNILSERRDAAKEKRIEVEMWINTIPVRMQRIVRMKFIDGLTWTEVAMRMNRNVSGDAVRKEFWQFLEKSNNKSKLSENNKENE